MNWQGQSKIVHRIYTSRVSVVHVHAHANHSLWFFLWERDTFHAIHLTISAGIRVFFLITSQVNDFLCRSLKHFTVIEFFVFVAKNICFGYFSRTNNPLEHRLACVLIFNFHKSPHICIMFVLDKLSRYPYGSHIHIW